MRLALATLCLAAGAAAASVPVEILKPEGDGPFPAVVMLHDCSGLGARSSGAPRRWAAELVRNGYVVAIPDSFSTRGFPNGVCVDPSPERVNVGPARRVPDAFEALEKLRGLGYVDGKRIGVMGGSHGGASTLATVNTREGFAAAIALYPSCARALFPAGLRPKAPLLILTGELDDWTPARPCEQLVEAAVREGFPARIKVYPGAHHSFDSATLERYVESRINPNAPGGRGATTGGNREAWDDSIREVAAFFAQHLGKSAQPAAAAPKPVALEPSAWTSPAPGIQGAWVVGAEDRPGIYHFRVKLSAGARIPPHTHPDERTTTVLSGAVWVGFGETIDETIAVRIPAGSVYVAPAGVPHYVWAKEGDAEYQESGVGPTATRMSRR